MYLNSMIDTIILAQAVLQIFCRYFVDKIALLYEMPNSVKY